ncbi:MAG: ATP-binding protein [Endomicrobiaceae bacterium]|nr:ATP-binding protein [Endomicrobiaceae bacterium]
MNYYALLPTITSVLFLFLGFFVFFKNKKANINRAYLIICLAVFFWLFPFSLMYWTADPKKAYIFAKIGFLGVLILPVGIFHMIVTFLKHKYEKIVKILYAFSTGAWVIGFFTNYFYSGIKICFWGFYPKAGNLYFLILVQFTVVIAIAMILLLKNLNNPKFSAIKQQQLKYLLVAFSIAFLGSGDYITKFNSIEIYPFGYILTLIFLAIISLSIVKTNLMDIKLALTQTGIFIVLYALILGVPFYLGFVTNQWIISSIMLFVLSTIGPIFFRYLQKKAEKILLAEQNAYQQLLVQASKGMMEQQQLPKLAQLTVRIIKRSVKVNFVYLFIFDQEKNKFICLGARGDANKNLDITFLDDSKICQYMKFMRNPFLFLSMTKELKELFSEIHNDINLIVPSMLRDKLIAFLVLGEKTNKTVYSSQDIEVFKTLSNQAGLAVENCNFLAETQKQQKRLFDAEKLASIGGMADGMAHQIKNRLNVFLMGQTSIDFEIRDFEGENKEFVENNPKVKNMVEEIKEIIAKMTENVKKTDTILKGILSFAKTTERDTYFGYFAFKEIVDQSMDLMKVKHGIENIPMVLEIPEEDKIYGVKSQIQEVIYNCLDNAYEAIVEMEQLNRLENIKNNFKPEIKVSLKFIEGLVNIEIADNGIGIKKENEAKIFSAFFTTKPSSKSGSGIGAYVTKRMIEENHNGKIIFKTKYRHGSSFLITLPMSKNLAEPIDKVVC